MNQALQHQKGLRILLNYSVSTMVARPYETSFMLECAEYELKNRAKVLTGLFECIQALLGVLEYKTARFR